MENDLGGVLVEEEASSSSGSSNDDIEFLEMENNSPVMFDRELAAEHSYMGEMDRVTGVNFLEPGKTYQMPIKCHLSLIYPGETVPMFIDVAMYESLLNDTENGMSFGLIFPSMWKYTKPNFYGVTCQIYEKGPTNADGNIKIKTRVYQRFVIYPTIPNLEPVYLHQNTVTYIHCKILPDINLPGPLTGLHLQSLNKFRSCGSMKTKIRNFESMSTVWPAFVYDLYDVERAIQKIKQFLISLETNVNLTDPLLLSFWLAKNIPLTLKERVALFITNSVSHRMLSIGKALKDDCILGCKRCQLRVAYYSDLFPMSTNGIQSNFCNPSGFIHETLTLHSLVENSYFTTMDSPSTEFSWFPGYSWQILCCADCEGHLGWKFVAVMPNLKPEMFFGLAGKSIETLIRLAEEARPE